MPRTLTGVLSPVTASTSATPSAAAPALQGYYLPRQNAAVPVLPCRYGCDQNDLLSGSHNASLFTDTGNEIPGIATNHGDFVDIGITAVLHLPPAPSYLSATGIPMTQGCSRRTARSRPRCPPRLRFADIVQHQDCLPRYPPARCSYPLPLSWTAGDWGTDDDLFDLKEVLQDFCGDALAFVGSDGGLNRRVELQQRHHAGPMVIRLGRSPVAVRTRFHTSFQSLDGVPLYHRPSDHWLSVLTCRYGRPFHPEPDGQR